VAVPGTTTFTGSITVPAASMSGMLVVKNVDNIGSSLGIGTNTNQVIYIGNASQPCIVNSSTLTANSFVKSGGLVTDFLKANGTVDSNTYLPIGAPSIVSGYPFNPANRATTVIAVGSKQYWFTVLMSESSLISGFTLFLNSGSDSFRMGIYRGYLKSNAGSNPGATITLCGQSSGAGLTSSIPFNRVAITAVVGQTLSFAAGEYMTIAFHSNGGTNSYIASPASGTPFTELTYTTLANYVASPGFPATLGQASISSPNNQRPCFELY
jgi:hypothetical protein